MTDIREAAEKVGVYAKLINDEYGEYLISLCALGEQSLLPYEVEEKVLEWLLVELKNLEENARIETKRETVTFSTDKIVWL